MLIVHLGIYGLASLVASLVKRQDALLLAMLATLICGVLDGFGPRLTLVKTWGMEWLWYMCPGTWYAEAFFSEHIVPFSYLYDIDAAARFVGYVTGRTALDICLIFAIGVLYRILAYIVLILPIMDFRVIGRFFGSSQKAVLRVYSARSPGNSTD
ncbi:hypothetical protein N7444_008665 [Penicillium canescens]|nr:hypothetical protein N7444_008665 [Penicillium canescens]